MSDANGFSTSSTQKVVPMTKLQVTITEVVKQVLTELKARRKSNNKVTPSNAKGR